MGEVRFYQTPRWALALTAVLSACVTAPSAAPQFIFPGRGLGEAQGLTAAAERMFAQVAECADAPGARPRNVMVRLYLPGTPWECPPATGGCSYLSSSEVRIAALAWRAGAGYSESFGHEATHLARWLTTGDADAAHRGPWWVGGRACQAGLS